jgi:predicted Zn-dependent protease
MTRLLRWTAALAAGVLILSCADIGAPLRSDLYEYRRVAAVGDTLSFHWPASEMPVRFWVKDTINLPAHADSAIAVWKRQFLYHEFDGIRVQDSSQADVIVLTGFPPGDGTLFAMIDACEGLTDMRLDPDTHVLHLPIHVYLVPRYDPALEDTQACLNIAMIHEFGHALGILRHSPNVLDIMYTNPTATEPTSRDRNTVQVMYHAPVNVTISRGGAP